MRFLQTFLSEFLLMFGIAGVVYPLIGIGRIISLQGNASSIGPRSFSELNSLPEDEQKRLLHAADRKAFPGWRCLIPIVANSVIFSSSVAVALTLSRVGAVNSEWTSLGVAAVVFCLGMWILRRFEAKRIRPFLLSQTAAR